MGFAVQKGLLIWHSMSGANENRVPPGQSRTERWPLLHVGAVPPFDPATWRLEISGDVQRPLSIDWGELTGRPQMTSQGDFHCVTGWSRLDNLWEGYPVRDLAGEVGVRSSVRFLIVECDGGYTTNMPIEAARAPDSLLATRHDGRDLSPEHGGPLRLVVPQLYAWKSAKWVRRLQFVAEDRPGFWENRGYSSIGDPWTEDRYA